ncbi:MAG: ribonuclease III [Pseudomonadales bacterium]|nr:ribonuclease III [Pseudomonadales bacterium]
MWVPTESLTRLSRRLGYTFNDPDRLAVAMTHRSYSNKSNYETLEFLGDSIVNFVIADALFHQFPDASEGQLSRLRAKLVQGKTLASISREFELGDYLRMGSGELKSGGFRRDSILADVFEAIVGAIYEDSGFDVCRERILYWFQSRLTELSLDDTGKDPKSVLQEFLQGRKIALPDYKVVDVVGLAHDQTFTVSCSVKEGELMTQGIGESRRKAEQIAASDMMTKLTQQLSMEKKLSKEKESVKQAREQNGLKKHDK